VKKKKGALSSKDQREANAILRIAAKEADLPTFLAALREGFGLKDEDPAFQRCVRWWHENHRS